MATDRVFVYFIHYPACSFKRGLYFHMKTENKNKSMLKLMIVGICSAVFLTSNLYAQPIGACGPVDYYHAKILDADQHLDSWHKDKNGPLEYIVNLAAEWWGKAPG